jgi:hypothetical protein
MDDQSSFLRANNSFYFSENLVFEDPDPWSSTQPMTQIRAVTDGITAASIFRKVF